MITTPTNIRSFISRLKIGSSGGRGFRRRASPSPGSKASATPWMPFVTRFNHSNCTGSSGSGSPVTTASSTINSSAAPIETSRQITLRMLS